eukprot:TRINITY_DN23208_c0_g1_i2.p1 TRINITY_DN23208_c0_g1~~TRINITY_DN23208_c0_g1_i2.p1  ORF type:complete len:335 (+),score=66.37 TRINITY_DN23208_c0_g1_i2:588-1592(+)
MQRLTLADPSEHFNALLAPLPEEYPSSIVSPPNHHHHHVHGHHGHLHHHHSPEFMMHIQHTPHHNMMPHPLASSRPINSSSPLQLPTTTPSPSLLSGLHPSSAYCPPSPSPPLPTTSSSSISLKRPHPARLISKHGFNSASSGSFSNLNSSLNAHNTNRAQSTTISPSSPSILSKPYSSFSMNSGGYMSINPTTALDNLLNSSASHGYSLSHRKSPLQANSFDSIDRANVPRARYLLVTKALVDCNESFAKLLEYSSAAELAFKNDLFLGDSYITGEPQLPHSISMISLPTKGGGSVFVAIQTNDLDNVYGEAVVTELIDVAPPMPKPKLTRTI